MAATAPVAAQAGLPIPFWGRVRVWLPSPDLESARSQISCRRNRFVATFLRSMGDTVIVMPEEGGSEVAVPAVPIAQLEASGGRHARTGRGALIGLATGGAIVGAGLCTGGGHGDTLFDPTAGEAAAIVGVAGGLVGLGIGALVGSVVRTETWRRVPLAAARLSLAPAPNGGVHLGLSIALGAIPR